jgi:hypothetical protein
MMLNRPSNVPIPMATTLLVTVIVATPVYVPADPPVSDAVNASDVGGAVVSDFSLPPQLVVPATARMAIKDQTRRINGVMTESKKRKLFPRRRVRKDGVRGLRSSMVNEANAIGACGCGLN